MPTDTQTLALMSAYCTTYCNKPHDTSDGKPIGHECYILPPAALAAEIAGDVDQAIHLITTDPRYMRTGSLVRHAGKRVRS